MATKTSEQSENGASNEVKDKLRDDLLTQLNKKIEEMKLGTPDEEVMKNFEELLSVLPEGKLRQMAGSLETAANLSGKSLGLKSKVDDFLWRLVKPMLVVEVPWVALIPGDVNGKLLSAMIRIQGRIQVSGLKGVVAIGEKIKKIKERGEGSEKIVKVVLEEGDPKYAIGEILS
ncbi:hypothetical protein ISR94_03940 [Candidatus Microgenomates bacterium]|nr:hypothetical protein [Candidatus Microgenomates bacterium]